MKLLVDQGLPRATAALLRAAGHDAEHVGELGMARADDTQIIALAVARKAVIVTFDGDFHNLLAKSQATRPSVIRIRIERLKHEQSAAIVLRTIEQAATELEAGAAVSITERGIRVHTLPLGG